MKWLLYCDSTVRMGLGRNEGYNATSLSAHHCFSELLNIRLWLLGWGWGLHALPVNPLLQRVYILSVVSGAGEVCTLLLHSCPFNPIKIKWIFTLPLLKSCRPLLSTISLLPEHQPKSADFSAQKEDRLDGFCFFVVVVF